MALFFPLLVSAISVPWDRPYVGRVSPINIADGVHVNASSTFDNTLRVNNDLTISGGITSKLIFPTVYTTGNYSAEYYDGGLNTGGEGNDTFQLGYNLSDTLYVGKVASEPQMYLGFESNWRTTNYGGATVTETYIRNLIPNTSNYLEPFFTTTNRNTNTIEETKLNGSLISFGDGEYGITGPFVQMASTTGITILSADNGQGIFINDTSGLTYGSSITHHATSPFRLTTLTSKGGAGSWRGAFNFDVNYNAGSTFTAATIRANTDGTTANIGIGNTTPSSTLEVAGSFNSWTTGRFGGALTLAGITGSTQCLNVNTNGLVSGTGSACGSGGAPGAWQAFSANVLTPTNTAATILVNSTDTTASSTITRFNANTATTSDLHNFGKVGAGDSTWVFVDNNVETFAFGNDDSANRLVISSGAVLGTGDLYTLSATEATTTVNVVFSNLEQVTGGTNNALCIDGNNEVLEETTDVCAVSSRRFKKDIARLTVSASDILDRLEVVSFSMIDDEESDYQNVKYGLIAEDVAAIDPHLVQYGVDGLPRTLDDRAILALLVKAMQERKDPPAKFNWLYMSWVVLIPLILWRKRE